MNLNSLLELLKYGISTISGGVVTFYVQKRIILSKEKKKKEKHEEIVNKLMDIIWKDKFESLLEPLLNIQEISFKEKYYRLLFDILLDDHELISPSLVNIIGEEDYEYLKDRLNCINEGYSFYDALEEGIGLKYVKDDLNDKKNNYENLVLKSISELKELKKDIRSQSDNDFIEELISLQKMINILETTFLLYIKKDFISNYIDLNVEITDSCGEVVDAILVEPTINDYLKLLHSKDEILEKVKQKIKQDTLFNEEKWKDEVGIKVSI